MNLFTTSLNDDDAGRMRWTYLTGGELSDNLGVVGLTFRDVCAGSLSIFGSLFIIVSFFLVAELRNRELMQMCALVCHSRLSLTPLCPRRVFFMSVSDLFFSLKFFLPAALNQLADANFEPSDFFCFLQAFSGQVRRAQSSPRLRACALTSPRCVCVSVCVRVSLCVSRRDLRTQFFGLASISWYACIAWNAWLAIWDSFSTRPNVMQYRFHLCVPRFSSVCRRCWHSLITRRTDRTDCVLVAAAWCGA